MARVGGPVPGDGSERYAEMEDRGKSEYGAPSTPVRYPDGSSVPFDEIAAGVGTRARLLRQAGIHNYDPDEASDDVLGELTDVEYAKMSAAQKEAYDLDMVLKRERQGRRADLRERTVGYIDEPELYRGEEVSGSADNGAADVTGDFS